MRLTKQTVDIEEKIVKKVYYDRFGREKTYT